MEENYEKEGGDDNYFDIEEIGGGDQSMAPSAPSKTNVKQPILTKKAEEEGDNYFEMEDIGEGDQNMGPGNQKLKHDAGRNILHPAADAAEAIKQSEDVFPDYGKPPVSNQREEPFNPFKTEPNMPPSF